MTDTPAQTYLNEVEAASAKFRKTLTTDTGGTTGTGGTTTGGTTGGGTTTPPANPSGEAPPIGDLPGWKQDFVDDFSTPCNEGEFLVKYGDKWWAYPRGWKDTWTQRHPERLQTYEPKILSVRDSKLVYAIRSENGIFLTAAPCPILPGAARKSNGTPLGFPYGRSAIRFRSDALYGFKIAFLLWPDDGTGSPQEIDFPELNLDGKSPIKGFMHKVGSGQDWRGLPAITPGEWHTCVMEWRKDYCGFFIDGVELANDRGEKDCKIAVPVAPMHIVLQAETNLDGSQQPSGNTRGNLEVDWFAHWRAA